MKTKRLHAPNRYLPLDELLATARVRVLRALRHFDWATSTDLCVALGELNVAGKAIVHNALSTHVEEGNVERLPHCVPYSYRITAAGRAELAQILSKGEVNEIRGRDRRSERDRRKTT